MIYNPYTPAPAQADAWSEGFSKGFLGSSSTDPGANVGEDEMAAFNEGVLAGIEGAENGITLGVDCLEAGEEHGSLHTPAMFINGAEVAHGIWEMRHLKTLAGGVAGIFVAFIELACTLPAHTRPPRDVLPSLGQPLIDQLAAFGIDSAELFIGAGLDPTATDCEIQVSRLYSSMESAREAAIAMQRSPWLIASWRTDQSNSFRIIEAI